MTKIINLTYLFETKKEINETKNEEERKHLQKYYDCMLAAELDGTANIYREYYQVK